MRPRGLSGGFGMLLLGGVVSCATPPERAAVEVIPVQGSIASWDRLREAQAARLERLDRFTASGSILIDFVGESGDRQSERAEHRFWRVAPDRAAVRLSKAGVTLSMSAWNGGRWWVMDESGDEVVLEVHRADGDAGDMLFAPPLLVAMSGLSPFPDAPPSDFVRIGDQWRFTMPAPGSVAGPSSVELEVTISSPADGPSRIVRRGAGGVPVHATLARFDSVEGRGRPPGDWGTMPGRIELSRGEDVMVITLDRPLAGGEISANLFDLEAQIRRSQPAVVKGATTP